jgi:hypothetical protein
MMGKKDRDEEGRAVRDNVSERGRFRLNYLCKDASSSLPVYVSPVCDSPLGADFR